MAKATRGKAAGWMASEDRDNPVKILTEYGGMEKARPAADYFTNEFFDGR